MYPPAIVQTSATAEETAAVEVARRAVHSLTHAATSQALPGTANTAGAGRLAAADSGVTYGALLSFHDARLNAPTTATTSGNPATPALPQRDLTWSTFAGEFIMSADPRYAWVAMFQRNSAYARYLWEPTDKQKESVTAMSSVAQVVVVVVRCRNRPAYDTRDLAHVGAYPATLEPALAQAQFNKGTPSTVQFTFTDPADAGRLAADAFVVVSQDGADGRLNGRVFRIGNPAHGAGSGPPLVWELAPGGELAGTDPPFFNAAVFVLGRGYADPGNPAAGFAGPAQDVAAFRTFIRIE